MKLSEFDFRVWDSMDDELMYPSKNHKLTLGFCDSIFGENELHAFGNIHENPELLKKGM